MRFLILILFSSTLFSVEDTHIAIGSRPMNEEAALQTEMRKTQQIEEEGPIESAGFIFDHYPPVYYSNSHHWLAAVTVLDNNQYSVELEDGSVWKINSYDGFKALHWKANDPLAITQNTRWFSKHNYKIINKSTGSSVEASFFLGPVKRGQYSRFIIAVDHPRREIMLSDNTHWEISYLDAAIFKDWALNDYIIIGTNSNNSFWDSGSDALLINVNMNTSTRAKQF